MPSRKLGRIIVGAAGPVALTITSAMMNPAAASEPGWTTGPAGVARTSGTFNNCTYYAYQPVLSGTTHEYASFWAGFNCPTHIGYSLDIFVQKRGVTSSDWATPNTSTTHLPYIADNPTNYFNYLGQECSVISHPAPYYIRTKAVISVGGAGGPGSTAIYSPQTEFPATANC
jgi:hypothetical protein